MISIDTSTLTITCPRGDTGLLTLSLTDGEGNPLVETISGVALFAVCQNIGGAYNTIKSTYVNLTDNTAMIRITNEFSRFIPSGTYYWDVRIVVDPEFDENGNITCNNDTDEVHSLYAGRAEGMPKFIVMGVAVNV